MSVLMVMFDCPYRYGKGLWMGVGWFTFPEGVHGAINMLGFWRANSVC